MTHKERRIIKVKRVKKERKLAQISDGMINLLRKRGVKVTVQGKNSSGKGGVYA